MKTLFHLTLLALTLIGAQAQQATGTQATQPGNNKIEPPQPTAYRVVDQGANNRVWQRETIEQGPNGMYVTRIHKYTELGSGLNYWDATAGKWTASQNRIEAYAQGAIARQGQYQVIFANNLNSASAIDQQTPDGKRLRSNILGLAYYDSSTGQRVMIAQIQDSQGELISANQAMYPNAFEGVKADICYTYKKASFEQDVILRAQPPTPESVGLNSETTEIEVLTEFIDPPEASVVERPMKSNSLSDADVGWGAMRIGRGKAFEMGDHQVDPHIQVRRQYVNVQGRHILIEGVPLQKIESYLQNLPLQSSITTKHPVMASKTFTLPKSPLALTKAQPMKLAANSPSKKGFVLDYVEINSDQSDFTFQGDTTYYVSGDYNMSGTTTIEGGTVIKYDNNCSLNIAGTLKCLTAAYRPALLTSSADTTVGENVSGGSGAPPCTGSMALEVANNWSWDIQIYIYDDYGNYIANGDTVTAGYAGDYAFTAGLGQHYVFDSYDPFSTEFYTDFYPTLNNDLIDVTSFGDVNFSESGDSLCTPPLEPPAALALAGGGVVHDLHIGNVSVGISSAGDYLVTNVQFVSCGTAFDTESASLYAGNILMSIVGTAFYGQYFNVTAQNVTFDQGTHVTDDPNGSDGSAVTLVNALLSGIGDDGVVSLSTSHIHRYSSSAGVYQTVGAASYYLATGSTNRGAGTAGIDTSLLADLQTKTTYPPIAFSGVTIPVTNLYPQALRDTNSSPDLGYHYDALDYAFGGSDLFTNLTLAPGTATAYFEASGGVGSSGQPYGLSLNKGATFTSTGTASAPCWFVDYKTVMECGNGNWTGRGWMSGMMISGSGSGPIPQLNAQWTRFSTVVGIVGPCRDNWANGLVRLANCELYMGGMGCMWPSFYFTNCLFMRAGPSLYSQSDAESVTCQNCTFYGGSLTLCRYLGQSTSYWNIKDTAFDGTSIGTDDRLNGNTNYTSFDYNAFLAGANLLEIIGSHSLTNIINFNWQSSWLGNYYLTNSSPLIDAGSTTADQLGLYHFTTQTNQVKETNSIVDIGYHYVATDTYGNPLDNNSNGIPDYLDDSNGNGLIDSGEIGWNITGDLGLKVLITRPRNGSILP